MTAVEQVDIDAARQYFGYPLKAPDNSAVQHAAEHFARHRLAALRTADRERERMTALIREMANEGYRMENGLLTTQTMLADHYVEARSILSALAAREVGAG